MAASVTRDTRRCQGFRESGLAKACLWSTVGLVRASSEQWSLVEALSEPQRRAVYELVCARSDAVTREQVAGAVGISRSLAAFHLDKLVDAGLLEIDTTPPAVRRRTRVGRPAKRYQRSALQIDLTLPTRQYELAGRILAAALAAAQAGEPPQQAATRIAYQQGRELGTRERAAARRKTQPVTAARRGLEHLGYAPERAGDRLTLANCPFHAIVEAAPDLTCGLNLALIEGLLAGLGLDAEMSAVLQPRDDACCVTLTRT